MHTISNIQRVAAFTSNGQGGNPAGVLIDAALPDATTMQRLATVLGYSETVFAAPLENDGGWRVRYFAPDGEVPFCGHATIALGAVLAQQQGNGLFVLTTNHARITVEGHIGSDGVTATAALQSPPTSSAPAPVDLTQAALALFGYREDDLDARMVPAAALANGGAGHQIGRAHV